MGDVWVRQVFRLRDLPNSVGSPDDVARLLSTALGIPADQVIVYSVARTSNVWEKPPSKVATLRLKNFPTAFA